MRSLALALFVALLPVAGQATTLRWPVTFTQPWQQISSTFGPRLQASNNYQYEFHTGIDIAGTTSDQVVAAKDGEVYRLYQEADVTSPYPNGGNVVILKHRLTDALRFHGQNLRTLYTVYMHLDSINSALVVGETVSRGAALGYIGQSGSTEFDHLHFEVRASTVCSLRSSCNKTGFDPHIHPLRLLSYPETNHWRITRAVKNAIVDVTIRTPHDEADLNRITLTVYDINNIIIAQRRHNFSTRKGFNASTVESLNNSLYRKTRLDPARYSTRSQYYRLRLHYQDVITPAATRYAVSVCDVKKQCRTKSWTIQ